MIYYGILVLRYFALIETSFRLATENVGGELYLVDWLNTWSLWVALIKVGFASLLRVRVRVSV